MMQDILMRESEGGRIYVQKPPMKDCHVSVVHKKKPYKRPFFYSNEIAEVMSNNFISRVKKSYDTRTALQRALPTTVKG